LYPAFGVALTPTASWATKKSTRRPDAPLGARGASQLSAWLGRPGACDGSLPALLRPRPPASLTHGDLWAANLVQGRWLVDPAVSFADRELELAYMQLSNSLSAELLDAYLAAWPPDPEL
jgi:hypothetical protein